MKLGSSRPELHWSNWEMMTIVPKLLQFNYLRHLYHLQSVQFKNDQRRFVGVIFKVYFVGLILFQSYRFQSILLTKIAFGTKSKLVGFGRLLKWVPLNFINNSLHDVYFRTDLPNLMVKVAEKKWCNFTLFVHDSYNLNPSPIQLRNLNVPPLTI